MMKGLLKIRQLFRKSGRRRFSSGNRPPGHTSFDVIFETFQKILAANNRLLTLIADMGDKLSGEYIFDSQYIRSSCRDAADLVHTMITGLNLMAPGKYKGLNHAFQQIFHEVTEELNGRPVIPKTDLVMPYNLINKDIESVVGAKNANIGEVKNLLELTVPDGFAITTRAYELFMAYNQLRQAITHIVEAWQVGHLPVEKASEQITAIILEGRVPGILRKSIEKALEHLYGRGENKKNLLAVRSSAWGEDGAHSFAGQYLSLLNVPADDLLEAYKQVIAGAYTPSAMEYRRNKDFEEFEVIISVGCQLMVDSVASGVLYTFDPQHPERDVMLITAIWGQGAPLVDGRYAADRYQVNRRFPYEVKVLEVVSKTERVGLADKGGIQSQTVEKDKQDVASLSEEQLKKLTRIGLKIERHFKTPRDIEFTVGPDGNLIILQARPLNIGINRSVMVKNLPDILGKYPLVFEDKGSVAQRGIAIGKVYKVLTDEDLDVFPDGAVLVAKRTSPRFARVIRKTSAIITDVGTATGHMATVAREFRVPTIVNTGIATKVLSSSQKITVDAEENRVYDGFIKELRNYHLSEDPVEETKEFRLLRRVLKIIGPLNLMDPTSENFAPSRCRTFHDITRFIHEKSVEELIDRQYYQHHDPSKATGKLKLSVPLDLVVIDIGDGLQAVDQKSHIMAEQVQSIPMKAFINGIQMPGAWSIDPMPVGLGSFMSSMTRTFTPRMASPRSIGQNLAVISKCYCNVNLRLGYHFNMIDAYIDDADNINNNHLYFRFFGGVTDMDKRSRRARLLGDILSRHDFRVSLKGDLVIGRLKKLTTDIMLSKLNLIGLLVGFSRQLDVRMLSDQHAQQYAEKFDQLITSTITNHKEQEGSHYEQ